MDSNVVAFDLGSPAKTADALARPSMQDPLRALDVHAREELGLYPRDPECDCGGDPS